MTFSPLSFSLCLFCTQTQTHTHAHRQTHAHIWIMADGFLEVIIFYHHGKAIVGLAFKFSWNCYIHFANAFGKGMCPSLGASIPRYHIVPLAFQNGWCRSEWMNISHMTILHNYLTKEDKFNHSRDVMHIHIYICIYVYELLTFFDIYGRRNFEIEDKANIDVDSADRWINTTWLLSVSRLNAIFQPCFIYGVV